MDLDNFVLFLPLNSDKIRVRGVSLSLIALSLRVEVTFTRFWQSSGSPFFGSFE